MVRPSHVRTPAARRLRQRARLLALVLAMVAGGCSWPADEERSAGGARGGGECVILRRDVTLPSAVRETSGAVIDPRDGEVFWTHNDSGHEAELFAIARDGRILARVAVSGAENRDWEDLALGPCPEAERCLFLFDTGDSGRRRRDAVALYRVPLPGTDATSTALATRLEARFPGGNRDAEAGFVLPDGSVYLVNKGQQHAIELWHWPAEAGEDARLERVRTLAPTPDQPGDRVTGAAASPDGRWVALRTYGRLFLYRTDELLGSGSPAFSLDLAALGEPQGEAVALGADGTVLLTSEGGPQAFPPRANWLRCVLP
jgi:hypothetical protein